MQPYGKLPAGPPDAAAAVVGRTLAVVGGTGTGLVLAGPLGGKLVPVARLSRPRANAQAFALNGNLYVLGGEQGGKPGDDLLRIDLANGHGRTVSKFVEPLAEAGVATRGKAVYLVGGWTGELGVGKVFVLPLDRVVRIRTGETENVAVTATT